MHPAKRASVQTDSVSYYTGEEISALDHSTLSRKGGVIPRSQNAASVSVIPGPQSYLQDFQLSKWRRKPGAAIIPKSPRFREQNHEEPGPGSYSFSSESLKKQSAVIPSQPLNRNESRAFRESVLVPGPGEYEVSLPAINSKGGRSIAQSSYSLEEKLLEQKIGPCRYKTEKSKDYLAKKAYNVFIRRETKPIKGEEPKPWPGKYSVYFSSLSQKGAIIPKGDLRSLQEREKAVVPGPCKYNVAEGLDYLKRKAPGARIPTSAYSLGEVKEENDSVGPGLYRVEDSIDFLKRKNSSVLIPRAPRDLFQSNLHISASDGPGSLEPKPGAFKLYKGVPFSNVKRFQKNKEYSPGPGDYSLENGIELVKKKNFKGVKFSVVPRLQGIKETPGPGDYDSEHYQCTVEHVKKHRGSLYEGSLERSLVESRAY